MLALSHSKSTQSSFSVITRFPKLTLCDFSRRGYVKDLLSVYPILILVENLKTWITDSLKTIDLGMLASEWRKIEHRLDVCCIIKIPHVENL